MGRLSEYDIIEQDLITGESKSRFYSGTLPRVDKGLENWTTEIQMRQVKTTPPVFSSDMHHNRDHSRSGGRVLPYKGSD